MALPFGASLLDQNRTQIQIMGSCTNRSKSGNRRAATTSKWLPSADGWFETEAECGAGTKYHYVLQDGTAVPDPASRGQYGDVHGESIVVDPQSYRWRETNWRGRPWHEAVIYELHVGAYGGFTGVARELSSWPIWE